MSADVADVLKPIWQTKYRTAQELRGRIEAIFDYAKAMGYRDCENPAVWKGVLKPILGTVRYKSKPQPALPYVEIGAFMSELRKCEGMPARALEFVILTATREGETLGAQWDEIDMNARIWTIPAERMKAGKEHRVPLSDEAMKLLESLSGSIESRYVFPTKQGSRIANVQISRLVRRIHKANIQAGGKGYIDPKQGKSVTTHGFRSTFRDWAAETTEYAREICEYALAHKLPDKVEEAYQRSDLLVKRTRLMADWSRYCG
jgi:integrase